MHLVALTCTFIRLFSIYLTKHNPLVEIIIIINSYKPTRIIILPVVVTIFASQVCSLICLKIENAKVITRGRTFTIAMSVRCYGVS